MKTREELMKKLWHPELGRNATQENKRQDAILCVLNVLAETILDIRDEMLAKIKN